MHNMIHFWIECGTDARCSPARSGRSGGGDPRVRPVAAVRQHAMHIKHEILRNEKEFAYKARNNKESMLVSLLFSALYAICPYYVVLYMQCGRWRLRFYQFNSRALTPVFQSNSRVSASVHV